MKIHRISLNPWLHEYMKQKPNKQIKTSSVNFGDVREPYDFKFSPFSLQSELKEIHRIWGSLYKNIQAMTIRLQPFFKILK